MEKWVHTREESETRFNSRTGEKLSPEFRSWIKNDKGEIIGSAWDSYLSKEIDGKWTSWKEGAIERGNLMAAAPEAVAFAKRMSEFFACNPTGYDDLRAECMAILAKAYPKSEVANAS